ncbi:MAG: M3 family metallopeptidase [Gammaproteobacteria bacterium]|nr:M3 family metallopeptidase [Gammaproteobacteria bacterium]
MNNPLLEIDSLPAFSKIKPEHILPAIEQIIADNRQAVGVLISKKDPHWHSLIDPLALLEDRLSKSWSPVRHMNSVKSSDSLREAYEKCLPLLSEYTTEISQNRRLYDAYKYIAESKEFAELDAAQQKAIDNSLKHFRLGGVDLEAKAQHRYQQLQKEISALQSSFENNLLDASQSWELVFDNKTELGGVPDYALSMQQQLAEQKGKKGYRVTLDMPCYIAVITYADSRALRKKIYQAYTTRASEQRITDIKWDNSQNMVDILAKRQEKALLLGFTNYAEYSLETKMADSAEQVIEFLQDLARHSEATAQLEVAERQAFAVSLGLEGELEAWDYAYYSEKLKQQRYEISDEDLKPYFSDQQVINGLFEIVKKLYRVDITRIKAAIDVWDKSVSLYQIKNSHGAIIGQFYLDLYAREKKRGGAWMDECINRYRIDNKTQLPVAYLTCNLTPPIGDEPALFTHEEVITLFHEFGHGLHHLLTKVDVPDVAGINGVEWDAVELPSQFLENFCWQKQALQLFARHYQTGEVLPDKLFEKMTAAKNFQSALQMLRQIEFALFDIKLHQQTTITNAAHIQKILDQVREQVSVVKTPADNRFQHSFAHIFAGGYAAGYYSYKWAEVLSADAFSAFEEKGIFSTETGQRFLNCILETGGSRPAMESFHCFRGRQPNIEALLRHSGITS